MVKIVDPHEISSILREQTAIHIMPRFRQLKTHEIMSKTGPTDLVTVADQEMERALIDILPGVMPGSTVLGEEGISSGAIKIEMLDDISRPVWVTDPVDGTFNFAHGKEEFCTMLALVIDGRTQMSWIFDPLQDRMMIAESGEGAFIKGQKISFSSSTKNLSGLHGFAGLKYFHKNMRPHIEKQSLSVGKLHTLSCAGHEYLALATGSADFSIYTKVKPWDHLAGQLMIGEAGGYLKTWDGSDYTPQTRTGGILAVTDKNNWQPLHDTFLKKLMKNHERSKN